MSYEGRPCSCKNKTSGNHECLKGSTFHSARVKNVNETPDVDPKILQERAVASDYNQMLAANPRQSITVAQESSPCQCHSKPQPGQFHPAPGAPSNDGSFSPASVHSHPGFDDAYNPGPSNVPQNGNALIPPFGAHAPSHPGKQTPLLSPHHVLDADTMQRLTLVGGKLKISLRALVHFHCIREWLQDKIQ